MFATAAVMFLTACSPHQGEADLGHGLADEITTDGDQSQEGPIPSSPEFRPRGLKSKFFVRKGKTYGAMDIANYELQYTFDVKNRLTRGKALLSFRQKETSRPVILFAGDRMDVKINGEVVNKSVIQDPAGNQVYAVDMEVNANETQVAEIDFTLPSDRVSYLNGGVGFLTDMADLVGRFFERWAPANYEDDQFPLKLRLQVQNSSSDHQLFTNGVVTEKGNSEWEVQYPSTYGSTSFFIHLTNRNVHVRRFVYSGVQAEIPVTVYSGDEDLANEAAEKIPQLFSEIEADYGAYPHPKFLAYIGKSTGGMEYVGATITSMKSLSHELFHSWFARGVLASEGRSGWIDEAIASWRDNGYPRINTQLSRSSTNLASYSEFLRATPMNSYRDGRALLSEWDALAADQGGMRPLLRDFFAKYQGQLMTTEEFYEFMRVRMDKDLDPYFKRYVYGGRELPDLPDGKAEEEGATFELQAPLLEPGESLHPSALTDEELKDLR